MENNQSSDSRGALIVLEGLDRCGKTSQSSRLVSYLESLGHAVESWRFPDRTTNVGQMISSYLANKSHLDDRAVHLLFSANRWEKSPKTFKNRTIPYAFYMCNLALVNAQTNEVGVRPYGETDSRLVFVVLGERLNKEGRSPKLLKMAFLVD
ncbi:dTMP kinase [Forsythia ovata]|uniref:dTMP kinase n=1 Tax=Forsythia ovata TaxID=205694 RepID=A0ABD1UXG8_9LAMI